MRSSRARFPDSMRLAGIAAALAAFATPPAGSTMSPPATGTEAPAAFADSYVRHYTARLAGGPTARWVEAICPKVIGLAPQYSELVARRIREVAREAGAGVARPACKTNTVVTFTYDAKPLLAEIVRREPSTLAEMPEPRRRMMLAGELPIAWWYRTTVLDADGRPLANEATALLGTADSVQLDDDTGVGSSYSSSLIRGKAQRGFRSVAVVVDMGRIQGRTLRSISSYVALVALAEIKPAAAAPTLAAPSLLTAFADGHDPQLSDLSALDRAFLAAIYRVPGNRPGDQHRSLLVSEMKARIPN